MNIYQPINPLIEHQNQNTNKPANNTDVNKHEIQHILHLFLQKSNVDRYVLAFKCSFYCAHDIHKFLT